MNGVGGGGRGEERGSDIHWPQTPRRAVMRSRVSDEQTHTNISLVGRSTENVDTSIHT